MVKGSVGEVVYVREGREERDERTGLRCWRFEKGGLAGLWGVFSLPACLLVLGFLVGMGVIYIDCGGFSFSS